MECERVCARAFEHVFTFVCACNMPWVYMRVCAFVRVCVCACESPCVCILMYCFPHTPQWRFG